ncbi:MarR family transcriptional regulator [Halomonas cupida]|uniref:MarR family winged helix-turn-helix transcriptional regulator n=1 Tax=Halomonas cupida TaxID=44933 RepID=UPI0039B58014
MPELLEDEVPRDAIDRLISEWCTVLPDRDPSDMGIFTRLYRIMKHVDRRVSVVFRAHGLREGEFDLLSTLYRRATNEGMTPNALCAAVVLSSGAMTNRLDRLAERDLIERVDNPEDRRSVLVRLSDKGREMMPGLLDAYLAELGAMREALDVDHADALAAGLRALLVALEGRATREGP